MSELNTATSQNTSFIVLRKVACRQAHWANWVLGKIMYSEIKLINSRALLPVSQSPISKCAVLLIARMYRQQDELTLLHVWSVPCEFNYPFTLLDKERITHFEQFSISQHDNW